MLYIWGNLFRSEINFITKGIKRVDEFLTYFRSTLHLIQFKRDRVLRKLKSSQTIFTKIYNFMTDVTYTTHTQHIKKTPQFQISFSPQHIPPKTSCTLQYPHLN